MSVFTDKSVFTDQLHVTARQLHAADGPAGIRWEPTLQSAFARAEKEQKPLFMQFAANFDGRAGTPFL